MIITSRWQTFTIKHQDKKTHPETCSDISVLNNPGYLLIFQIHLTLASDKYMTKTKTDSENSTHLFL